MPPALDAELLSLAGDDGLTVDAAALMRGYPGPAAMFDAAARLVAANDLAGPMTDRQEVFLGELGALITSSARDGVPIAHRFRRSDEAGDTVLDLAILPIGDKAAERRVVVLGRDSTFDVNLQSALISSRRLFQDLVSCSVDFAWETRTDGRFSFVSSRGALGFTAEELDGRAARELLCDPDASDCVFETQEAIEEKEIWLRRADGEAACVRVSATPVFGTDGDWQATRGVCRDITEARLRDAALARAREREALIRSVVDTIRRTITPEEVYAGAVARVAETTGAAYAAIMRRDDRMHWRLTAEATQSLPSLLDDGFLTSGCDDDAPRPVVQQIGGWEQIAAPCRYHDEIKGWLSVVRAPSTDSEDHTRELVATVADHIGIAMAQEDVQKKLERLSRVDELTGLLNRRAFREATGQRLAHGRRTGRCGALLFVDMDNFKAVNDVHGHQAGDDALVALADILAGDDNRQSDIVARLGGDEFALWLEETERDGAVQRAERLLARCKALERFSGAPDKPLSVSIGVVVTQPYADDDLDRLIERADEAMYRAKRGGKGRIAVVGDDGGADREC